MNLINDFIEDLYYSLPDEAQIMADEYIPRAVKTYAIVSITLGVLGFIGICLMLFIANRM